MNKILFVGIFLLLFAIAYIFLFTFKEEDLFKSSISNIQKSIYFFTPAFVNGEKIPKEYTCYGNDTMPTLKWENIPKDTKSFVIIVFDPDAPKRNFVHFVKYNIPKNVTQISSISNFGLDALNDINKFGWFGPCPPKGATHHYVFRIYAINATITTSLNAKEVLEKIKGKVLAYGEFIGMYE